MIRSIEQHKDRFGVEAICRVLRPAVRGCITSRGYRAAVSRPASTRRLRDDLLVPELLKRQGWAVGRDQTERLMRLAGVRGVRRAKSTCTTRPDPTAQKPQDLVQRRFTAPAPRKLWVCDATDVATWSGFASVAFVTDVFSARPRPPGPSVTATTTPWPRR